MRLVSWLRRTFTLLFVDPAAVFWGPFPASTALEGTSCLLSQLSRRPVGSACPKMSGLASCQILQQSLKTRNKLVPAVPHVSERLSQSETRSSPGAQKNPPALRGGT